MSSHRQIIYQVVFGTKNRESTIPETHCEELYKYIWGIIKNKNCKLYRINGVEDHIHILSDLHPSVSLSDYVKDIKVASSLWMKEHGKFTDFKGWQDGYGAFTYSIREKDMLVNYIKNQKEHHKAESFFMTNTGGCSLKMKLSLMRSTYCEGSTFNPCRGCLLYLFNREFHSRLFTVKPFGL